MKFNIVNLDDIVEYYVDNRGKTCPTTEKENEYLPLIATNCINEERLYPEFLKTRSIDEETYLNWFRSHPKPGDIIFVNKGTPGKTALVPEKVNFCIAQDMVALRVKAEYYNRYIYAVLNDSKVRNQIDNMQVGTLIPHFKKTDFKNLKLKIVPDKVKQKKIGDLYFNICQKIEINYSIIEKLQQISQSFFKKWFIDFEFPNEEGKPYKSSGGEMVESELGEIPEAWEIYNVNEFAKSISNSINKKEKQYAKFLNTSDVLDGEIADVDFLPTKNMPGQAKKLIEQNDILYSEIRPKNKRYAYIQIENADDYVVSTKLMVLRTNEEILSSKLFYIWLTMQSTINELNQIAESRSGTFPQITFSILSKFKLALPPKNLMDALTATVTPVLNEIYELRSENKKLVELRDTLLPKLLSGEIEILDDLEG